MASPSRGAPIWVFSYALFPLGLGLFVLGTFEVAQGVRSRHWSAVPAVVIESRLVQHFPTPAQPEVHYRYDIAGRPYVSDRIWPGDIAAIMPVTSRAASVRLLSRFPEGTSVTAWVDPADPTASALVPGARRAAGWLAVFTFFLWISVWGPGRIRSHL
jgi:hypothetical protein